jgi:hypothetical protein
MKKAEIHGRILAMFPILSFLLLIIGVNSLFGGYSLVASLAGGTHAQDLGMWVAGAGNLNGDAYNDVIIGQYGGNWETFILFGDDPVDSIPDIILPTSPLTLFSNGVSGVGDVNFDGFDDVIIGQEWLTHPYYIYFGGNPMDSTPDVTLVPSADTIGIFWGDQPVSGAGDVNNDSYSDVIIGNARYNAYQGMASIYYGGDPMDDVEDVVLSGENTDDYFGWSVRSAGDVNDDGFDDVIVGAYSYGFYIGRAYVYLGGDPMDNSPDVILTGEGVANYFAFSVSSAGDVNYDGYDDVIVGAYNAGGGWGRAYIYHGGDPMDNTADVVFDAPTNSGMFGYTVSSLGKADNDNYDDVVVAAPMNPAPDPTEKVFVYLGGDPMATTPAEVIRGEEGENYHFGYSLDGAGDLDNNGYDDLIIGSYGFDNPGDRVDEGKFYIYCSDGFVGIELSSFEAYAENGKITLSWKTETEMNNALWILTKATVVDEGYTEIARIPAKGTSSTGATYKYTDADVIPFVTYYYKLGEMDINNNIIWRGPVAVMCRPPAKEFQNPSLYISPNPASLPVTITYVLPHLIGLSEPFNATLEVHDLSGRCVRIVENNGKNSGAYSTTWNGCDDNNQRVAAGVYFVHLKAGDFTATNKLILVR